MIINLQIHEFWSVVVKANIIKQQEHPLWRWNIINKNMGLGIKLESNGSENHQKSAVTGPSINLPRLNNILSLNIASVCHFFNAVMVTSLWKKGQVWYGSIQLMIWNNWMYIYISYKIQGSLWHKNTNLFFHFLMFKHGSYS